MTLLLVAAPPEARAADAPRPGIAAASPSTITKPAATPAVALDSMTRDGGAPAAASVTPAEGQSMNIGGALLRTLLSLALVLALAVGAIKYLKRKGYGVGSAPAQELSTAPKAGFGVSPAARLLLAASKRAPAAQPAASTVSSGAFDGFEVLGAQALPGSSHTLYKVRVGERVLLLGGNASGALNLLTELDTDAQDGDGGSEEGFGTLLGAAMSEGQLSPAPPAAASGRLQSAADRLTAAIERAGAADSALASQWRGSA